jgi:hypothetical protein
VEMQAVVSSWISCAGWENDTLFVLFHDGTMFKYPGVTELDYIESSPLRHSVLRCIIS